MLKLKARDGRDPRELASMDVSDCFGDVHRKTKYVQTMFDVIAPGYDTFTRWFSFGMDRNWKAHLIRETARRISPGRLRILDLACGTGDLGIELAGCTKADLVVGCDLSPQMLREAQMRVRQEKGAFTLVACDALHLCLPDNSVDVVTIGYGLRNMGNTTLALGEIARVMKPGGLLANLDFNRPVGAVWREFFLGYMGITGNIAGWLWHREPSTYGYIAPSIRQYLSIPEFEAALRNSGFEVESRAKRLGGAIGIHVARRR